MSEHFTALQKTAGALQLLLKATLTDEDEVVRFTGDFVELGSATYRQILDEADAVLEAVKDDEPA